MASHDEASSIFLALSRGVTRSKRRAHEWLRKAAENGEANECLKLALHVYRDDPYAREIGHVEVAAGFATSAEVMEGLGLTGGRIREHDVPPDVLTSVLHWLQKGCHEDPLRSRLNALRYMVLKGAPYCHNDGCVVEGLLKEFKVCPQCKTARYCGDACQKQDWNAGGHKEKCGQRQTKSAFPPIGRGTNVLHS